MGQDSSIQADLFQLESDTQQRSWEKEKGQKLVAVNASIREEVEIYSEYV